MEYLPRDVLKIIFAKLDDEEVNLFYRNRTLGLALDSIFENNSFLKIRAENLLKIEETDLAFNNWKRVYYALLKTKDLNVYAENGDSEIVELLLVDSSVYPSADNNYAIRCASENGYYKVFELLLADPRVDPSANNNYAIRLTSRKGHDKVVKLLLA